MATWSETNLTVYGLIVGIAAMAVSIFAAYFARHRKQISWLPKAFSPLTTAIEGAEGRLTVLFDGKPVTEPELAIIRIRNSGNVPVLPSDFEHPLEFSTAASGLDKGRIYSAEIVDSKPPNLGFSVEVVEHGAKLSPTLLNPGDSITVRLIGNGLEDLSLDGRVVGVRRIAAENPKKRENLLVLAALPTMFGPAVFGGWVMHFFGDGWAWSGILPGLALGVYLVSRLEKIAANPQ